MKARTGALVGSTLGVALLVVVAAPAAALATECEGRCEDETDAVMTVSGGECDRATEHCRSGCDVSVPGRPRPYAECVSRVSGEVVPRRAIVVPTDNRRE